MEVEKNKQKSTLQTRLIQYLWALLLLNQYEKMSRTKFCLILCMYKTMRKTLGLGLPLSVLHKNCYSQISCQQ